jgi:hypothetical protein
MATLTQAPGPQHSVRRARQAKTLESWLLWPSVPITQTGTNINEGEVYLRMKYRQPAAVAPALALQAA